MGNSTMQKVYKRIGISGGTFDPIHFGHLIIAEEVRELLKLDIILFIPVGNPPHKEGLNVADAFHRFNMVKEAVKSNPFFKVSRIEVDRLGYTYTVDTLTKLKEMHGENVKLLFITGADVVRELLTWKEYERVFTMCEFAAVLRPGYEKAAIVSEVQALRDKYGAVIHIIDGPLIEISSTQIRDNVKNGRSVKYLVPDKVEKYIYENGLYK